MVLKFIKRQGGQSSVMPTIEYNAGKTDRHVATLVELKGIPGIDEIEPVFDRLCRGSLRATRDKVLHMALCPEPGVPEDDLSEDRIRELVHDIMEGLGYGGQPWVVYRHFDIDRTHYHIVSCKIGPDGKKISDSFDYRRAQELMKALMPKYGYTRSFDNSRKERARIRVEKYDWRKPAREQLISLVSKASGYSFSTFEQYAALMASMGVNVKMTDSSILYSGFRNGRQCTLDIPASEMGVTGIQELQTLLSSGAEALRKAGPKPRYRVSAIGAFALKAATSERPFCGIMRKCGIDVKVSRNSSGEVFGITYLDHQSRCCWKASDVPDAVKADELSAKYASGEWEPLAPPKASVPRGKSVQQSSREATRTRVQNALASAQLDRSAASLAHGIMSAAFTGKEDDELERDMDQSRRQDEGMGI